MKTFNLLLGIVLGLVIGLLSALSAALFGMLYFVTDTKKSKPSAYRSKFSAEGPRAKDDTNPFDYRYESRKEAERVLDVLISLIVEDGHATVEDLKLAIGITPMWRDSKKGWKSLSDASIRLSSDQTKYIIRWPTAVDI